MGQLVVKFKQAFQHAISKEKGSSDQLCVRMVEVYIQMYKLIIILESIRANPVKWIKYQNEKKIDIIYHHISIICGL